MNSKIIANGILRAIAVIIGIALLVYFLYKIQSVIVYIILAAIMSLIARPVILFLRKKLKFPNTLAVVVTMLLFLAFTFGLISMFIPLIYKQGVNLSLLDLNKLESNIEQLLIKVNLYFSEVGVDVFEQLKSVDVFKNFKEVPYLLNTVVSAVGSISIGLFSVLFISFFLMKDSFLLNRGLLTLVPKNKENRFQKSFEKIKDLLSRYFLGLILQISILFIIYMTVLLINGVNNAIVIAFLCALLNLIPYIGPLIGGVLMLTLTMTSDITLDFKSEILPTTTYVLIGYVIAQLIDNFVSQPKIFSEATKAHPLEIFLVIIIGGLLFGVVGMIVAVPVYTAIKVILKEFLSDNKIVKSLTKDL